MPLQRPLLGQNQEGLGPLLWDYLHLIEPEPEPGPEPDFEQQYYLQQYKNH
jgi:hypothetical protein